MSIKKLFALVLALLLSISVLASCNKTPSSEQTTPSPSDATTPVATTPEETTPSGSDNLPPETLEEIALTSVRFITGDSALELFCVAELEWYFAQKNITVSKNGYPITISVDDEIIADGYQIEASSEGLFITGGTNRGLAYALYNFLEKYVGVGFYAPNTITTTNEGVVLPFGVLDTFTPAFEILRNPWQPIEALSEKDGGNILYHDHLYKTLTLDTLVGTDKTAQPCLSKPENLLLAIDNANAFLAKYPGLITLTFAPAPGTDKYCKCENCTAIDAEEGSPSGAYLRFINSIIEAVAPKYPDLGFAIKVYGYLQAAPTLTKPAEGVVICMTTADCHATHSITDETCPNATAFVKDLQSWVALGSVRLDYVLSGTDYLATFANFNSLRENVCFFAQSGIESIYCSGNFACPSGEFGELRAYLVSKLLQNPTMSEKEYNTHMNEFLSAYYGSGWVYIRSYIDKVVELATNDTTEGTSDTVICGQSSTDSPFCVVTTEEYLSCEYRFDNCWDIAEELAGDHIDAVKTARLQWEYIKLCLYPDVKDAQTLISAVTNAKLAWRENQKNVSAETNLDTPPINWIYAP